MLLNEYFKYETALRKAGFKSKDNKQTQPQSWIRDEGNIRRIFLFQHGGFNAYDADGHVVCTGSHAWEIGSCI